MSIENPRSESAVTGIATSFHLAKIITIDMGMFPPDAAYRGFVSIIRAKFSSISSEESSRLCHLWLHDKQ